MVHLQTLDSLSLKQDTPCSSTFSLTHVTEVNCDRIHSLLSNIHRLFNSPLNLFLMSHDKLSLGHVSCVILWTLKHFNS